MITIHKEEYTTDNNEKKAPKPIAWKSQLLNAEVKQVGTNDKANNINA